ncbi:exopolyphosphatase/guanosine-5'-triphosphate,3'-diphosphate pyrophosphatase [Aquimarina sp. EL_43]|uniref:Ppx/GppA phosphatase family protein n=1 Tax=unclassified Aquimarina TaxID=2627091 RepID=UPI0018C8D99D|nr:MULTISPECIES: exopolyphosphatase [unclassified Aquimarina]MBG6129731.1 exopolyphosphatase/guanosine-5'-triphosphate,3'-diphosphate pyrophosphatase [Aquimarina sp. EL_35]MBG6150796.1 exopolyphosphatase/guanosine-5'-triphosphate,3'-diphosphate pyrophosphatase [Aquimarina sp. EL_32]MBG6167897.1 exopolyphosphatase/guanosine-5'-triphosphate,3'-diphosphate pyrophosphatase [Aquimarina sp. EL_43]
MLTIEKYGAIDIGSNAVRLLISSIHEEKGKTTRFKKTSLVRVPIRLGEDVFKSGRVSHENITRMIDAMQAYQLLMKTHKVIRYKACATSAMREAENGEEVAHLIKEKTGIQIDIIDGKDEAAIIAMTDLHELINTDATYLYVDVGGGSTEFTLYHNGNTVKSRSFKLGTVRLLNNLVSDEVWKNVEDWIKESIIGYRKVSLIGSGGNINNIFKNSGKRMGKSLSFLYLSSYYKLLNSLTYEERIWQLNLNQDRADVIIPATRIYLSAMKWSGSREIFVPKIGLSDGIIKSLYNEKLNNR